MQVYVWCFLAQYWLTSSGRLYIQEIKNKQKAQFINLKGDRGSLRELL